MRSRGLLGVVGVAVAVTAAAVMIVACEGTAGLAGGGDGDAGSEAGADGAVAVVPSFELHPASPAVRVVPGTSARLRIDIDKRGLEPTLVTITAKDLPAKISSETIVVPLDGSFGELKFDAAPDAAFGKQTIQVTGVAGQLTAQANVVLTVAPPPGTLDKSFGSNGNGIVDVTSVTAAAGVAAQPDGKIVIVGVANAGGVTGIQWGIARFLSNGVPDASFGIAGRITMGVPGCSDGAQATAVAIDGVGQIFVGGYARCPELDYVAAKFLADGKPAAFGTDGQTRIVFPGDESPTAIALLPGGELLLGGTAAIGGGAFGVVRFKASGDVETTFGAGGRVTHDPSVDYDFLAGIALQPTTNKIVAVGLIGGTPAKDHVVARFTSAGLDTTTFGVAGTSIVDFSPTTVDGWTDLVVEPDGKIVIAGASRTTTQPTKVDIALARLLPDGAIDTTFGTAGKTSTNLPTRQAGASAIARMTDGSFVICGFANMASEAALMAARYLPTGQLDTSFGTQGVTIASLGAGVASPIGIAVQPDGAIVCASSVFVTGPPPISRSVLVRYTP